MGGKGPFKTCRLPNLLALWAAFLRFCVCSMSYCLRKRSKFVTGSVLSLHGGGIKPAAPACLSALTWSGYLDFPGCSGCFGCPDCPDFFDLCGLVRCGPGRPRVYFPLSRPFLPPLPPGAHLQVVLCAWKKHGECPVPWPDPEAWRQTEIHIFLAWYFSVYVFVCYHSRPV